MSPHDFAERRDVLQARSALLALETILRDHPMAGSDQLAAELERVTASAHEFAEIRLLNALRSGAVKATEVEEMERLLGAEGTAATTRLGLDPGTPPGELRAALEHTIGRWQRRAENPLTSRDAADAARVLVRTCEGLLVDLR